MKRAALWIVFPIRLLIGLVWLACLWLAVTIFSLAASPFFAAAVCWRITTGKFERRDKAGE